MVWNYFISSNIIIDVVISTLVVLYYYFFGAEILKSMKFEKTNIYVLILISLFFYRIILFFFMFIYGYTLLGLIFNLFFLKTYYDIFVMLLDNDKDFRFLFNFMKIFLNVNMLIILISLDSNNKYILDSLF